MDDTKREEPERACKKIHKVRTRMVAVHMVRVRNMSVEETVGLQVRCSTWVRNWLYCYDERDLECRTHCGKDSFGSGWRICSSAEKRGIRPVRAHAPTWEGAGQQRV